MLKDKNILLCCRSKTGYTRTYTDWIEEIIRQRFGAECHRAEGKALKKDLFSAYDLILYGGGLYAGKINGIDWIKKERKKFPEKKVILFAVGMSSGRQEEVEKMWKMNLKPREMEGIETFYFRGGFDFSRLDRGDRFLMSLMKKKLERETVLSEDAKGMLKAYETPVDFTDREALLPLISLLERLNQQG